MIILRAFLSLCLILTVADKCRSQINQAKQFYCDGKQVGGWTKQDDGSRTTFLFAQYSEDELAYRQILITMSDDDPRHAIYQNAVTRKVCGRYDLETGRYSLLPYELRKTRLEDISESDFPTPGELPTIEELLKRPGDKPGSQTRLLPIPPTFEYPRLNTSVWKTKYTTQVNLNRVSAKLEFSDDTGKYKAENGDTGSLTGVKYDTISDQGFTITGVFILQGRSGTFEFHIPKTNIHSFTGTWVMPGGTSGVWDGVRIDN